VELVTVILDEAEQTPDWDMQQLRAKINQIQKWQNEMSDFEHLRFQQICERFRKRMQSLMPGI
jgi:hypothetical protein